MSHIFISYSHQDSEYAHKLAETLEQNGFSAWIDDRINYGSAWPRVIQEHVETCSALIVIMSQNSFQSDWVQNELVHAKNKSKPVFPLLLEGEAWLSVASTQYVDVRSRELPPASFYLALGHVVPQQKSETKADSEENRKFSRPQSSCGRRNDDF